MQKSFIASLALSFVFAFATSAYLSSPFTIHLKESRANADTVQEATSTVGATSTVSFSALNLITIEEEAGAANATSSVAEVKPEAEAQQQQSKAPLKLAVNEKYQTAEPVRLVIPSIGLTAPIQSVGINDKGEMAVPDGGSSSVGWYKFGTIPGNIGSAVIDAHVFAAFDKLQNLKVGSEVYVENADGNRLTFAVVDSRVYKLGELTSGMLFSRKDGRRLNLITCAGEPTADGSTYTHRLVVYTQLVA